MEIRRILNSYKENLLFLLIFIFAALLYLFNINFSDLWIDETFTKALVQHPFSQIPKLVAGDFHPPLYFFALKLFTSLVGVNNFTIRLFSVIGALSTLIISYAAGQRVFGKNGALCFCLLLLALPMTALYSHNARSYTWASFVTTGVFLYSFLFLKTNKKSDLIFLGLFSLMAAYIHYYCLIAAFWANLFVLIYLVWNKNKSWLAHLAMGFTVFILFSPWVFVILAQTNAAQKSFWIPEISAWSVLTCYSEPFARFLWLTVPSYLMIVIVYGLTLISIYVECFKHKDNTRTTLGLALVIFNFTILTGVIISLALKPLLYPRYIMTIVTMLMVPPALFFMRSRYKWLSGILLAILLGCGIYITIAASYFSFGPYKQSIDYLLKAHPDIKKIVHINEVVAGPLYEYDKTRTLKHFWLKNENTAEFTNMKVFDELHACNKLDDILEKDEVFCVANFEVLPLNKENFDLILSQSQIVNVDTVVDNKAKEQIKIMLYILKYQGKKQ